MTGDGIGTMRIRTRVLQLSLLISTLSIHVSVRAALVMIVTKLVKLTGKAALV